MSDKPKRGPGYFDPNRPRCGAKGRHGPCRNPATSRKPTRGAPRCRMHGGVHPMGAQAKQALTSRKHGLYAKVFTDEEKEQFKQVFGELLDDPRGALIADAALIKVKAMRAAERADASGMVVIKQAASTEVDAVRDAAGNPVHNDSGEVVMQTVRTVKHIERMDVIGPVTDLLVRAGRLTVDAHMLTKKGIGTKATADDFIAQDAEKQRRLGELRAKYPELVNEPGHDDHEDA